MNALPFWSNGEVRLNDDGSVDEVVVGPVESFHLEQMSDDFWSLLLNGLDDRRIHITFHREGKSIRVTVEDDGEHSTGIAAGFTK